MSPVSTALPPPSVEILDRYWGPVPQTYANHGENQFPGSMAACTASRRFYRAGDNNPYSPVQEVLGHGGTGTLERWKLIHGRRCYGLSSNTVPFGAAWAVLPPGGDPIYSANAVNPGARVNEQAAVFSFTRHFALDADAAPPDDDRTGFFFVPWAPQAAGISNVGDLTPFGGLGGGFGMFWNDDGAGGAAWEFVAWDLAAVVSRTAVPAAVIPDPTLWSSMRFVIVTGGSDAATLTVDVNGTEIVSGQAFDNVSLFAPGALSSANYLGKGLGYMPAYEIGPLNNGNFLYTSWEGWNGRFTPQGVAATSI